MSPAQRAREYERIAAANGGMLHAKDLIEHARPKNSPLHSDFEWDVHKNSEANLLDQARRWIQITIRYTGPPEDQRPVPIFVSLSSDRTTGGGYRPIEVVLANPGTRAVLLEDALQEMRRLQRKYADLVELSKVFAAIEAVKVPVKSKPKRERVVAV